jgi:hypothetical protein
MQPNALDEDVLPRTYCEAAQDLPASTAADRALVALVRLLARQAVRDWLGQPETTEDSDTDASCLSSAVSAGERW